MNKVGSSKAIGRPINYDQLQNTENVTITRNYITAKADKLQQHGRPCKFILDRNASIVEQIKCFIVNNMPYLAPKSWREELVNKADIIRYRTTNKYECLVNKLVLIYSDDGYPSIVYKKNLKKILKSINPDSTKYIKHHVLDCCELECLHAEKYIGKDKFKNIEDLKKFYQYCCDNSAIISRNIYNHYYKDKSQNFQSEKMSFRQDNFRDVLKHIVKEVEDKETGYEITYRWKIGFKAQTTVANMCMNKLQQKRLQQQPQHPMLLRFIKKPDAVVISLYDPINSIDTVRFVVNNKNAIAKIKFTDFFPVLLQRIIYNLDKKYENNLYIRV